MSKIIAVEEVVGLSKQLHSQGKKVVVTGGCFDILHVGHIALLENAKKEGDILCVLLESDTSIKKRKGIERPIHSQSERARMVSALSAVDIVILLPEKMADKDYDALMQKIHPSVIAITEDDASIAHKERQAQLIGATIKKVNKFISSISTTKLIEILSKEI